MSMRLFYTERRDWMVFRAYLHPTRGVVRTTVLTLEPNVIAVWGPNFGAGERPRKKLPKPNTPAHCKRKSRRAV